MESGTKRLFTDTNGFLQVRDFKDIPWRDLFPGVQAVDVIIAPCVIEELDNHKTSTNQRRRNRARLALDLIDRASREPDLSLVLRTEPVRVRVVISTAPRLDWATHPNLDPANPDDQLVAEALSFGNRAGIFSHDTGPRIRARIAKIEANQPADEWLLPPEQTDDQRKITKLERDLEQALSRKPHIVAEFDKFDEATSEIRLVIPILQPLDSQIVDQLTARYLKRHPRAIFSSRPVWELRGISDDEVSEYDKKYSSFKVIVREHYERLHEVVQRFGSAVAVDYKIRNDSGVAAEGLRIEFNLEGNASLLAKRKDGIRGLVSFELPEPPSKPRSIFEGIDFPNIPSLQDHLKPRDPVAFYWFERPKLFSTHSACQCQEFRATREYADSIFVLGFDKLPSEFGLHMHISAGNLPSPVNISAKIIVEEKALEWSDPVVRRILPDDISKLVSHVQ